MTTDKALDGWKEWILLMISRAAGPLTGLHVALRDSEETKTYPGIYIAEGSVDRVESGGVTDGNAWNIEIETELRTTPGDSGQIATTKAEHDVMRKALSAILNDCRAQDYLNTRIDLTCFEILSSSPITDDDSGYRVTTWRNRVTCCVESG